MLYSQEMIDSAAKLLLNYFGKSISFSKISLLSEPDRRNLILRLELKNATDAIPQTLILKQTAIEKRGETEHEQLSRFAHDWAGIEFLTKIGGHHAPVFYVGDKVHKFIIIEDLGEHHSSLVGPLTREYSVENLQAAHQSLLSYVKRIGSMHADTAGKQDVFKKILLNIFPNALRYHFHHEADLDQVANQFKVLIGAESQELRMEMNKINEFAQSATDFSVLLHGDICPDNVFFRNNEMKIIDFEYADYGNALIDGVYLRMCMPSCWCSKAVPPKVLNELETIYREEIKAKISVAGDDELYKKQMTYVCAYWVLKSILTIAKFKLLEEEWICPSGPVDSDSKWEADKNAFRPRILSRLNAFVDLSSSMNYLPLLTQNSKLLLKYLHRAWPETNYIDLYPVFVNTPNHSRS